MQKETVSSHPSGHDGGDPVWVSNSSKVQKVIKKKKVIIIYNLKRERERERRVEEHHRQWFSLSRTDH